MTFSSKRAWFFAACVTAALLFAALSVWQFERRIWKLDLIARVDARIHAAPVPVPGRWEGLSPSDIEYRRVWVRGVFAHDKTVLVDALTERGAGAWVMTPLKTASGTVFVNRGFVPPDHARDYDRPAGVVTVVGLLRLPEPGGRFLRPNRPEAGLWYARDVVAMARTAHLGRVAPFFIDAQAQAGVAYPAGGLTVVSFRNVHLVYALTWLALAGMAGFGAWRVLR